MESLPFIVENVDELSPISTVPNEVLSHIFVLCSCDHPLQFPYRRHNVPYQVTISQVCSRWRQVSLCTGTLWNNLRIPYRYEYSHYLSLHQLWVSRAGSLPLTVEVDYRSGFKLYEVLLEFVVPFRLRTLHISLLYGDLPALSNLPNLAVEELAICWVGLGSVELEIPFFMNKTRRVCFLDLCATWEKSEALLNRHCSLWPQLRSLTCHSHTMSLTAWLNVLHQAQSLEDCDLTIANAGNGPLVGVSMPNLRSFKLRLLDVHPDIVIPLIATPNITTLDICSHTLDWSSNTYDIIKQHHKLYQLHEIHLLAAKFPLYITQVLEDAPMVRNLHVTGRSILDDEGLEGIASGRLGRYLTSLRLTDYFGQAGKWFDMIESRQRNVETMVSQASNWRQLFTGIRSVEFGTVEAAKSFEGRVATLKALGTIATIRYCMRECCRNEC